MPKRVLTGSALKIIAILTMAIDHIASHLLRYQEAFTAPLITYHDHYISWYFLLRCVGRLAFPIFAFLIVEGFIHTRDRRRYGRNLLVCALISAIPWALTLRHRALSLRLAQGGKHTGGDDGGCYLLPSRLQCIGLCADCDALRAAPTLSIAGTRGLYDAADEMGGRPRLYSYRDVQR